MYSVKHSKPTSESFKFVTQTHLSDLTLFAQNPRDNIRLTRAFEPLASQHSVKKNFEYEKMNEDEWTLNFFIQSVLIRKYLLL